MTDNTNVIYASFQDLFGAIHRDLALVAQCYCQDSDVKILIRDRGVSSSILADQFQAISRSNLSTVLDTGRSIESQSEMASLFQALVIFLGCPVAAVKNKDRRLQLACPMSILANLIALAGREGWSEGYSFADALFQFDTAWSPIKFFSLKSYHRVKGLSAHAVANIYFSKDRIQQVVKMSLPADYFDFLILLIDCGDARDENVIAAITSNSQMMSGLRRVMHEYWGRLDQSQIDTIKSKGSLIAAIFKAPMGGLVIRKINSHFWNKVMQRPGELNPMLHQRSDIYKNNPIDPKTVRQRDPSDVLRRFWLPELSDWMCRLDGNTSIKKDVGAVRELSPMTRKSDS